MPGHGRPPSRSSAEAGRVNHLAVRTGTIPGGRPGAGRSATAAAGELVVGGLLLPEQREAVIRAYGAAGARHPGRSEGSVTDRVRDRVRLESLSGRRRDELTERALGLVDELAAAAAPQGAEGAVASAVVDAALGLEHGVDARSCSPGSRARPSRIAGPPGPRRGAGPPRRHRASWSPMARRLPDHRCRRHEGHAAPTWLPRPCVPEPQFPTSTAREDPP